MKLLTVILMTVCSWLLCVASSEAQAILSPPFGLEWGSSPDKLYDWAERQQLDVTIHLPGKQLNERHIRIAPQQGTLPGHDASSLEARFYQGKLYEVTLSYADPTLSFNQAKIKFNEAKRALTAHYGQFKLSSKDRKVSRDQFITNAFSYHIEPVSGLFLMISYTEITDAKRNSSKATFSLVYHNDNVVVRR